jgi:hypothetical protein
MNDLVNSEPLNDDFKDSLQELIDEKDPAKFKDLTALFNINQSKKNAIRVGAYNDLLDKIIHQISERFEKTPGNFNNAELINYLKAVQDAMDRSSGSLGLMDDTPTITYQQNNQVNVNVISQLSPESREKIAGVLKDIMSGIHPNEDENIIEVIEEESSNE